MKFKFQIKVWYQNRRTKHKRFLNEDGNSSTNEIDHQNESEISDTINKHEDDDDEHLWDNEDDDNHYHVDLTHRQDKACLD